MFLNFQFKSKFQRFNGENIIGEWPLKVDEWS